MKVCYQPPASVTECAALRAGGAGLDRASADALALDEYGLPSWASTSERATIRYRSGSVLTFNRLMPGLDAAVLWWDCPAVLTMSGSQAS